MLYCLITILFGWFCTPVLAKPNLLERLDLINVETGANPEKALATLQKLKPETDKSDWITQREYLASLGYAQVLASKLKEAEKTASELEAFSRRSDNNDGLAESHLIRSGVYLCVAEYRKSATESRHAANLLTDQSPPTLRYWAFITQGSASNALGQTRDALTYFQKAADISETLGQPRRRAIILGRLSNTYLSMGLTDKALKTIEEAYRIDEKTHDKGSMMVDVYARAMVYRAMGAYEDQHRQLDDYLKLARELHYKDHIARAICALSDYYLLVGQYDKTVRVAREAQQLATEINGQDLISVAQSNAGIALTYLGKPAEGAVEVERAMTAMEARGDMGELFTLLREYGAALDKTGQAERALKVLLRERALHDEYEKTERKQIVLELEAKYESDKQQHEIALLSRENALKSAALENRTLHQRVWWLLIIALTLFSIVVGLLYRRVRYANIRLAERNEELAIQSARDPLTGLFNRRHFQHRMAHFAALRAERLANAELAAIYLIDIDHFKRINDRLGHAAGDAVLIALSNRLRDTLREADMIVRWGGEEFLVYVPAIPYERIDDVAMRIIATITDHPVAYEGRQIHVTASVGYATSPLEPGDIQLPWEREINLIDMALYLAKAHGRSRAFGIRKLRQTDPAALAAIEEDLEQAWHNGMVDLVVNVGPPPHPVD